MSLRHSIIGCQGNYHVAICLECAGRKPVGADYVCPCGGLVILVSDDNTREGVNRVENEVHRLSRSSEARAKLGRVKFRETLALLRERRENLAREEQEKQQRQLPQPPEVGESP